MKTIKITLPDEIVTALEKEAKSMEVSIDAVASIFLYHEVTHTLILNKSSSRNK